MSRAAEVEATDRVGSGRAEDHDELVVVAWQGLDLADEDALRVEDSEVVIHVLRGNLELDGHSGRHLSCAHVPGPLDPDYIDYHGGLSKGLGSNRFIGQIEDGYCKDDNDERQQNNKEPSPIHCRSVVDRVERRCLLRVGKDPNTDTSPDRTHS